MAKMAVDVVVLPDKDMTQKAIEASIVIAMKGDRRIRLNRENCIPHISLAMGCIDDGDIAKAARVVRERAIGAGMTMLRVVGIDVSTNGAGDSVSVYRIQKTEELQRLHERLMDEMSAFFTDDVTAGAFAAGKASPSSIDWVENYRAAASYENFYPHISLGYGELSERGFPMPFLPDKLALCHLADHCTCREVLMSANFIDI
jgi:hypothetical protein